MKNISWLCLMVFAFLVSCEEESVDKQEIVEELSDSLPVRVFNDVSMLYSQNSMVRLKLEAPIQNQYENQDEDYPEGLYLEIYDSLGVKTTSLVADQGKHDVKSHKFRVKGNVVVINFVEGTKLETEVLNWDQASETIYTDTLTPVVITTPKDVINANGLTANQDFSEYEITGGVTGIFTLKDE
ncbi:LPS export ABC transporter periplasmic protein LptC [Flammeovirgaceae bacterium SG7u.111]|nr:LPS export ABC transporter periplasmic protein LptC [Flammeovirgaceae bacterium SG7u.132]WPO36379.1 LPS export ABC transporter periplasmic protein LptC [Flammeovirgaceae bacterium SG7u.111]